MQQVGCLTSAWLAQWLAHCWQYYGLASSCLAWPGLPFLAGRGLVGRGPPAHRSSSRKHTSIHIWHKGFASICWLRIGMFATQDMKRNEWWLFFTNQPTSFVVEPSPKNFSALF